MITSYKEILKQPDYSFLKENPHLGNKICLLGMGGSISYGTNLPTSDIDIRGFASNSEEDLLGLSSFENYVNETTDTTVYSLNKLFNLLLNCNPNIIELLGLKEEHYLYKNNIAEELLRNKKLFLSKKCIHSFGGYATQQLYRLKNNIVRYKFSQSEKELHIYNSIINSMASFNDRYKEFDNNGIKLYVSKAINPELDTEIFMDICLKGYPLRDYKSLWSEMNNIVKDYSKISKRNKEKSDSKLAKHAMHLIRLYMMCIDILLKQEVITFRENEHDLLMDIRNEKYMENGIPTKEFWKIHEEYERRFNEAKEKSVLPDTPDYKQAERLLINLNKKALKNYE